MGRMKGKSCLNQDGQDGRMGRIKTKTKIKSKTWMKGKNQDQKQNLLDACLKHAGVTARAG